VSFLGILLRLFSYAFHLALSAFLLGVAVLAAWNHQPLALGLLPFSEDQTVSHVALLGAVGLLSTLLALFRVFRYLFPLWAGWALYLMVNVLVFNPYRFAGPEEFRVGLWLMVAAAVAFLGALGVLKSRRRRFFI
jgi:hypothetical protein